MMSGAPGQEAAPPGMMGGPPGQGAPPPANDGPGDACVVEIKSEEEFSHLVMKASMEDGPVLCDFYADWCGPCKTLTPRLEKAVLAAAGSVRLAKIDVDALPRIAEMAKVESLPSIVTIYKGKVIDNWQGVISEEEIDERIASYEEASGKVNPKRALAAASAILQEGNIDLAQQMYTKLAEAPALAAQATAGLAMVAIAREDLDGAETIVQALQKQDSKDPEVSQAISVVGFAVDAARAGVTIGDLESRLASDPQDWEAQYLLSQQFFAEGQYKDGMDNALKLVQKNKGYNNEAPRKLALRMFDALGSGHDLTLGGRKRLQMLMFA